MFVRSVEHRDGARIAALMASVFAEYPGCIFVPSEFPELDAITDYVARVDGRMWIAEEGDLLLGCVGVRRGAAGERELIKLYVARAHRRKGLGAHLVSLAEQEARARGATWMGLFSDTRFVDAHRLYERLGYQRTGEEVELDDVSQTREYGFRKAL